MILKWLRFSENVLEHEIALKRTADQFLEPLSWYFFGNVTRELKNTDFPMHCYMNKLNGFKQNDTAHLSVRRVVNK